VPGVGHGDDAPAGAAGRVKLALLSDVHANLPALEAVLDEIARRGVDATYHLGDLVGYAPWPNETCERVARAGITGVAGNYDSTVATDYKHCGCRYEDKRQEELSHLSYAWTRENTSAEWKRWLGALPFRLDVRPEGGHAAGPTVILVHGNQTLNTVYVTEDRPDDFLAKMGAALGARDGDVVAFGHTHLPFHRTVAGVHFVNTGSVGRPKDGDPRAGFVVLDVGARDASVEFVRVAYDVKKAADAIRASTLPAEFAEFLETGGRLTPRG